MQAKRGYKAIQGGRDQKERERDEITKAAFENPKDEAAQQRYDEMSREIGCEAHAYGADAARRPIFRDVSFKPEAREEHKAAHSRMDPAD